jgi:predicted nucleic acid-binding protein
LQDAEQQRIEIVTSFLTLAEVLRSGSVSAAGKHLTDKDINEFFERPEIEMVTVDRFVAEKAREIRRGAPRLGKNRFMVGDAIHVATALLSDVDALYSYDDDDLVKYDAHFEGLKIVNPTWSGQLTLPSS